MPPSQIRISSKPQNQAAQEAASGPGPPPQTAMVPAGSSNIGRMSVSNASCGNSLAGSKSASTGERAALAAAFQASDRRPPSVSTTTIRTGSSDWYTARTLADGSVPATREEGSRSRHPTPD